ncbi:MAG TPA: O-antigen ligase family protein [Balneolales bacterium]|nr:O-antigen ligase family protein [Balneolales bacterium]
MLIAKLLPKQRKQEHQQEAEGGVVPYPLASYLKWIIEFYPVFVVLIIIFEWDPHAYRCWHVPKEYSFIWLVSIGWVLWVCYKWIQNRSSVYSQSIQLSVIDVLLLIRFVWLVISNPDLVTQPSKLALPIEISLIGWVLLVRQNEFVHKKWKYWLRAIWFAGCVDSIIGIWQYFATDASSLQSVKTFMTGTIGSANGYGIFLSLTIIAALTDGWIHRSNKHILFGSFVASLLMVIALGLNGSRGAIVSLLVGLLIVGGIISATLKAKTEAHSQSFYSMRKRLLLYGAVSLIGVVAAGYGLYKQNPESVNGRFMIWSISQPMILDHPLTGMGYNRYSVEYLNYQARYFSNAVHHSDSWRAANIKQAHNEFLQAFYESGIPGGFLFIAIWVMAILILLRGILSEPEPWEKVIIVGLITVVLVHSLVDAPLHVLPVTIIAYGCLGTIQVTRTWNWEWTGRVTRWLMPAVIIGVFAIVTVSIIEHYPGYRIWQNGVEAAHRNNWPQAVDLYKHALDNLPGQGELQFHLGAAMVQNGQYSSGLYYLDQARMTFNDRNIYLSMSLGWLKLGQYKKARENAKTALLMFPDQLAPHLLLGQIYHQMGENDQAKMQLSLCLGQRTHIRSDKTMLIVNDARRLWKMWFDDNLD